MKLRFKSEKMAQRNYEVMEKLCQIRLINSTNTKLPLVLVHVMICWFILEEESNSDTYYASHTKWIEISGLKVYWLWKMKNYDHQTCRNEEMLDYIHISMWRHMMCYTFLSVWRAQTFLFQSCAYDYIFILVMRHQIWIYVDAYKDFVSKPKPLLYA